MRAYCNFLSPFGPRGAQWVLHLSNKPDVPAPCLACVACAAGAPHVRCSSAARLIACLQHAHTDSMHACTAHTRHTHGTHTAHTRHTGNYWIPVKPLKYILRVLILDSTKLQKFPVCRVCAVCVPCVCRECAVSVPCTWPTIRECTASVHIPASAPPSTELIPTC